MMKILREGLILICLFFCFTNSYGQDIGGPTCADAVPFCTAELNQPFNNCFNGSPDPNCTASGEAGPDYTCLGSTPFPTWYFLQIETPGDLNFTIFQNTDIADDGTLNGTPLDVDFTLWGPFSDTDVCDNLTAANTVDCSFSAAAVETANIPNAQVGEIYVFLITNFAQQQGEIFIDQADNDTGATDCAIVDPTLGADIDACEGTIVTLDATDPTAANYTWTFDDGTGPVAIPGTDGMPMIDVTQTGVYEVTLTTFDGDMGTDDILVTFFEVPMAPAMVDTLELCDGTDDDGFAIFDLDALIPTILNGLDPLDFTVTFHLSQADADDITNTGLVGTDAYNSMDDTIFARVENNDLADCFDTVSFLIDVFDTPDAITPDDINICDNDQDGDPTNGFAQFDLTTTIATILNGQDPTQFILTFHTSLAGANDGVTDLIGNPDTYINGVVDQEEIFVRVENNAFTDCFSTTSFLITVDPLPIINPVAALESCDDGTNPSDGISISFDTSGVEATLLGGQTDITITYVDGNNVPLTSPLPNPLSNTVLFTETITATLTNDITGCQSTNTIDLIVNPNPIANTVADLMNMGGCDDDGLGLFDTSTVQADVIGGQTGVSVTYLDGNGNPLSSPLPNPLANTIPELETITATVVNDVTGCSTSTTFNLIVNVNPTTVTPTTLEICDEDGTPDEVTIIDLTVKNTEITDGFDPTVTVSYHLTLAGANVNDASIPDPTMFMNMAGTNPQIVFARVTNNITGCFSTEALAVEVFLLPVPVVPADLEVCDVDNDGIFDFFILSDVDAEITGGDTSLTVVYYLTMDDANNAPVGGEIDNMMYINVNDPFFQT
ncbi:hypothetical protein SAMN06265376_106401, partial [Dokdonia pacifica]